MPREMMQRVFEFGQRQPIENVEPLLDQYYKEHKYYNRIIDLEHERRLAIRAVQATVPKLLDAEERADAALITVAELAAQARAARSHEEDVEAPDPEVVRAAREERARANESVKVLRAKYARDLHDQFCQIDNEYRDSNSAAIWGRLFKEARATCGVFWGTYLKIEQAFRQACEAETQPYMVDGRPRKILPWVERPEARNYRDRQGGLVAIHIQGNEAPMLSHEIFGNSQLVRIDPLPAGAFDPSIPRGQREKMQRTFLHLRIGSDEHRKPIWATWPIFMHRPLPEHTEEHPCRITWVTVTRRPREHCWRYEWKAQITVEMESPEPKRVGEAVAVNLGWRRMKDGTLRVATWADTAGKTGEVRLDASFRDRIHKSWDIRSKRDKAMDELRSQLVALGVPCGKWKSPTRYYNLMYQEIAREKQGESPQYAARVMELLRPWVYRDRHLHWYERGLREGALNYRRQIYRDFALELAKQYRAIIVETYDIRNISENESIPRGPSVQRVVGSPSQARQILGSTGERLGCEIIDGISHKATQRCHVCDDETPWDAAPDVMHTCPNGHEWDQDINNAKNMLSSAKVLLEPPDPLAPKKTKRAARFSKRHKKNGAETRA